MTSLSTHVLDTALGQPVVGIAVVVEGYDGDVWREQGRGETDSEGRISDLGRGLKSGRYRIRFATEEFGSSFFPEVTIVCNLDESQEHYHVPLLLSPFGYTTYRGT